MRVPLLALVLATVGCGSQSELTVTVRTNLAPGAEFDHIELELRQGDALLRETVIDAVPTLDYASGQTVTTYADIVPGTYTVRGALVDAAGEVLIQREALARVETSTIVTLVLTTACAECTDAGVADAGEPFDAGLPDAGPPDAGPPGVETAELCARVGELICAGVDSCCSTMTLDDAAMMQCIDDQVSVCEDVFDPILLDARLTYDPVRAAGTLMELEAFIAACDTELTPWLLSRDGYFASVSGSLASDADCTPPNPSDPTHLLNAILACQAPNVCRRVTNDEWRCRPRGIDGEACRLPIECENERCVSVTFTTRECGTGRSDGDRCSRIEDCASLSCEGSDIFNRRCTARTADSVYCGLNP